MASLTPSQTIGPFFHGGGSWLVKANYSLPTWVDVAGKVTDEDGKGLSDAMLEFSFDGVSEGFQRCFTNETGEFRFHAPPQGCAHVTVFARGLLKHLFTRVYLNAAAVPECVPPARRGTLIAQREGANYRWNIRLRGENETVFFDLA